MTKLKCIKNSQQLVDEGFANPSDLTTLNEISKKYTLTITRQIANNIDKSDPNDPIALQFIPSQEERLATPEELVDPIGDQKESPIKGIVHRYKDRCLLMPVTVCSAYCRFCFRKERVGQNERGLSRSELESAFNYIESKKELWEVILTGGDPLFIRPKLLNEILDRLESINHVEILRIHTRMPFVEALKIDEDMLLALTRKKPLYIILHANHAKEFSQEAIEAIEKLRRCGATLLSQSVLLKNINNNVDVLEELFRTFVRHRIKPYYLHHADMTKGTSHFRTTIEEGQALMRALRGRISGFAIPHYVLDIPGGFGKVPINHCYLQSENTHYLVEDIKGTQHAYPPTSV
ncbi:MAG: lysine-2,3-aminomutase-like protein [Parachlamydiales bacterium]|nr:lysine-2,3-aminomutase-like protein [Parachlamydiales bacterium]